jgi:uncharacterized repeat protein (TIGR03803 family)
MKKTMLWFLVTLGVLAPLGVAHAARPVILHEFAGSPDGSYPTATLVRDKTGNLFGTTFNGGNPDCGGYGCGIVFKIAADGSESVLYAFKGGGDGGQPYAGLIIDASGNLYGTTTLGGGSGTGCRGYGCGTVFKIAPDGTETVLYAFAGGADGWFPGGTLLLDKAGNLFGTTEAGGNTSKYCISEGCGTAFQIAPGGTKTTLYYFCSQPVCTDGTYPIAGLTPDKSGNMYGTTSRGGNGSGTVFRLTKGGVEIVLYAFQNSFDGQLPYGGVTFDSAGNLYGTTTLGGQSNYNYGAVYKLAPDGVETLLHSFVLGVDGETPQSSVIIDKRGNIYGTTYVCKGNGNKGEVFKLAPDGTERIFCVPGSIIGGLIEHNGMLYGTATNSKHNINGSVFAVKR